MPTLANSYAVNLLVEGKPCLVVGAGHVAVGKIRGLVRSKAVVTVVGPWVHPDIAAMDVTVEQRPYRSGEVGDYWLAITCTDDPAVNAQVFSEGEAARVWVNSADDIQNCAWILPAVARKDELSIAISTSGKSPAMASWMRRGFEKKLDGYLQLLYVLAEIRSEAKSVLGTSELPGWRSAMDAGVDQLVAQGNVDEAKSIVRSHLGLPEKVVVDESVEAKT